MIGTLASRCRRSATSPLCDGSTLRALIERLTCDQARALPQGAARHGAREHRVGARARVAARAAVVRDAVGRAGALRPAARAHAPLHLRALFDLVVRPARGRLPAALAWLDRILADAGRPLSPATLRPPHDRLGADLRGGAALALGLHAHLPPSRCAELAEVRWEPRSEEQRRASLRAVWAVLERERLAPCSALEFASAGRPPASASTASVDVCEERARPTFIGKEDAVALQQSAYTHSGGRRQPRAGAQLCVVLAVALHARLCGAASRPTARFRDEAAGGCHPLALTRARRACARRRPPPARRPPPSCFPRCTARSARTFCGGGAAAATEQSRARPHRARCRAARDRGGGRLACRAAVGRTTLYAIDAVARATRDA